MKNATTGKEGFKVKTMDGKKHIVRVKNGEYKIVSKKEGNTDVWVK